MTRPTILDVARRAGVSKSLVSLVMRESPHVSDEKRRLVLDAADALGYRPNAMARTLAAKRSHLVGVLVADLHNPFFAEVIDGIEEQAATAERRVLMTTGFRLPAREAAAIESLLELRVDGLVLADPQLPVARIEEIVRTVPTVMIARATRSAVVHSVVSDDRAGAELAVEHLVDLGHRRIAHIDGGRRGGAARRRAGYEAAMRAHGLGRQIHIVAGDYTEEAGYAGARRLLAEDLLPTAVFVANDVSALGALDAIEDAGLRVPEDISLVGYDNTHLAALHHISMTTVDQPRRRMGVLGVDLLLDGAGRDGERARHLVLPPELVVRRTTTPHPNHGKEPAR